MSQVLQFLFGEGSNLLIHQMVARALAVFFLTLILLRVSGRRSFGLRKPFDMCITVLLGAVLSRAVVGASPFLPTMAAGASLVLVHRVLAMLAVRFPRVDIALNGECRTLFRDGELNAVAMRKGLVCRHDLMQAMRQNVHSEDLASIRKAVLERNGTITILR